MRPLTSKPKLSRADQLRQKRRIESAKRQNAVRAETSRAAHSPTIIARNYSQAVPLYQSTVIKPKKARYYMNRKSGGEYRVRTATGIQFSAKSISSVATITLLVFLLIGMISPVFRVSNVNAVGLQRISASEVQTALDLNSIAIFSIDKSVLATQIRTSFPELANVQISLSLPGTLTLKATERVPVISWSSPKGTVWVDMEGAIFPARGEATPALAIQADDEPPVMLVNHQDDSGTPSYDHSHVDPEVLNTIFLLTASMPDETTLLYSEMDGVGWYDQRGWQVFIGLDLSNIVTKINEYEAIIGQLSSQGITPTMVSVEHVDAPFFRTE